MSALQSFAIGGVVLIAGLYLVVPDHWLIAIGAVSALGAVAQMVLLRVDRTGRVVPAVLCSSLGGWCVVLFIAALVPAAVDYVAVVALLPLLLAAARVTHRPLGLVTAGTIASSVVLMFEATAGRGVGLQERLPALLFAIVLGGLAVLVSSLLLFLAWQTHVSLVADATDLQRSRHRVARTIDDERARIERDLHDGAQQRFVAIAVRLRVALQLGEHNRAQAAFVLATIRDELVLAGRELDDLANAVHPAALTEHGLVAALHAAVLRGPLVADVRAEGVGRYAELVETNVYFACLEAMQNAVKHAGPAATVTIDIIGYGRNGLSFTVTDNGVGADVDLVRGGRGFANITDRMNAVGGTAAATSVLGVGTTITGKI